MNSNKSRIGESHCGFFLSNLGDKPMLLIRDCQKSTNGLPLGNQSVNYSYHQDAGLHYSYHRDYDPATGQIPAKIPSARTQILHLAGDLSSEIRQVRADCVCDVGRSQVAVVFAHHARVDVPQGFGDDGE